MLGRMIDRALERAEGKPDRFLLYVDQWEELYTWSEAERQVKAEQFRQERHVNRLIELLLNAARSDKVKIVGSMRADFYGRAIANEALSQLLPSQPPGFPPGSVAA
jgi:hypothetical protein